MSSLKASIIAASLSILFTALIAIAQVQNPGIPFSGTANNNDCVKAVVSGGNVQSITSNGAPCPGAFGGFANPTATAGPNAVNGSATTGMRSDAAPAIQKGSNVQFGLAEGDGTTINIVAGVVSATATGANPTATAGPAAANGSAATFMRSDAAPAVQKGTNAQFGIVEGDGSTINCNAVAGVCVVASTTFGGQSIAPGGSATMQGNGAKLQASTGTATSGDAVKFDANGNTIDAGGVGTLNIFSGTAALGTGAISSGTCASAVTVSATGVATTDVIDFGFNTDPSAITGYGPSVNGGLFIYAYPTSNNVNFKVCNNTAGSITPSAVTLNVKVRR